MKHLSINIVYDSITIVFNCITMKKVLNLLILISSINCFAQSAVELPLVDQFDVITNEWLEKSRVLKKYVGINEYCQNPTFRKSTDRLLKAIHEYDSLIISKMEDPTTYFSWDTKEEKKTLKDVHELEDEFGMLSFVDHMREACLIRNDIESNEENLRRGVGMDSYDGQILILETEMSKYLKKIDKLIVKIDEHLHVLHIE